MATEIALLCIAFAVVFSVIFGAVLISQHIRDELRARPATQKSIHRKGK